MSDNGNAEFTRALWQEALRSSTGAIRELTDALQPFVDHARCVDPDYYALEKCEYFNPEQSIKAARRALETGVLYATDPPKYPMKELREAKAAWLDADVASQEFAHAQERMLDAIDRVTALEQREASR